MSADPRDAGPERAAAESSAAENSAAENSAAESSAATRRRVCLILLLAVLVAAGFLWWRQRRVDLPEIALDHVDPAVREAVTVARAQVESNPRSSLAWGNLGEVLLVHDFADPAGAAFSQAALLDPHEPRWPYLQGRALYRDPEQAIVRFKAAARLCRDRPLEPRFKLAETLFEMNRLDEAEEALRIVERLAPEHPRLHLGLGRIALARADWPTAARHLEKAAATPFARQKASALLAAVYRRLPGHEDKAAVAAAQAQTPPLDLPFDSLDLFVQRMNGLGVGKSHRLARVENLQLEGTLREAAEVAFALVHDYPDDPWVHLRLAEVLLRGEDWRGGAAAARQALARDPGAAQAHFLYGVALFHGDASDDEAVVNALRRAVELNPNHGYAYNYLGKALHQRGKRAEALAAFHAACRCYPAFAEPQLHLADLWIQSGLFAPASFHLDQAARFAAPDDALFRGTAARLAISQAFRGAFRW